MPIDALTRRVAASPALPLFTHYDAGAGSRIELSGATFANWVDKTANLLDDLGVEPGEGVRLDLAATAPGHWVTAVWAAATWQHGCTVLVDDAPGVAVVVAGPDAAAAPVPTIACSLHPLGLAFPVTPAGCIDYAEVLAQPDVHDPRPAPPGLPAWGADVTFSDLAAVAPRADRVLFVDPVPGWETMATLLVAPLLGGGSTVVVEGGDAALAERIRADERATAGPAVHTPLR